MALSPRQIMDNCIHNNEYMRNVVSAVKWSTFILFKPHTSK